MPETAAVPAAPATPAALPDLRRDVFAAQEWVASLIAQIGPGEYGRPTPCTEFDVEAVLKHLYGVANRLIVMGEGRPAESAPPTVDTLPADVLGEYRALVSRARTNWADDASLSRMLEVPWGQAPGAAVLGVYLAENLAHGWDLAVATGQDAEADPRLAEIGLQVMSRVLPVGGRDKLPFDDPVEPADGAGATERLANWMGRSREV